MPNFTGKTKVESATQTILTIEDSPGHQLMMMDSHCHQTSNDAHFNDIQHHSCGTVDMTHGSGKEHGYFISSRSKHEHACGTYEGTVAIVNGTLTAEGTWKFTHGTGEFHGITGNGKYKAQMISPTEADVSFEGSYQLKAGTRVA